MTCVVCGEVIHDCEEGLCSYSSFLWLARAHHWEAHDGKPPEGLP